MAIGAENREMVPSRSWTRLKRMKRKLLVHLNKLASISSAGGVPERKR